MGGWGHDEDYIGIGVTSFQTSYGCWLRIQGLGDLRLDSGVNLWG